MPEIASLFGGTFSETAFNKSAVKRDAHVKGEYRFRLFRTWKNSLPELTVVMLNPSTADASLDDPTIRRLYGFAHKHGFGGFDVVNLFALRSTDPAALLTHPDPVGPDNDLHIRRSARWSNTVLCAWGAYSNPLAAPPCPEYAV